MRAQGPLAAVGLAGKSEWGLGDNRNVKRPSGKRNEGGSHLRKRRWYGQLEERWKTMPRTETFTPTAIFNRTSRMRLTWAFSSSVPCKCQTELTDQEIVTTVWLMLWFLY